MMRPALCDKLPASQSIFQCFRRQYHNLDYIVKIFDKSKVRLRNKLFFLRALILPADERSFQIGARKCPSPLGNALTKACPKY